MYPMFSLIALSVQNRDCGKPVSCQEQSRLRSPGRTPEGEREVWAMGCQ